MIYDAASLLDDLLRGVAGLVSDRTSFDDPGRMTWTRWLWIAGFTLVFVTCIAAADAFHQAIYRLLGL